MEQHTMPSGRAIRGDESRASGDPSWDVPGGPGTGSRLGPFLTRLCGRIRAHGKVSQ